MATWDVFHSDRLEIERALSTAAVREALARGDLRDDDLIRPGGTTMGWTRIVDMAPLVDEPEPESEEKSEPTSSEIIDHEPMMAFFDEDEEEVQEQEQEEEEELLSAIIVDDDDDDDDDDDLPLGENDLSLRKIEEGHEPASLEVVAWDDDFDAEIGDDDFDPQEEDEAAAEFTLARGSAQTVEELDLAAMVDVAFQLVLFFLVTATTVLYKSLEVPRPNPENNPAAAAAQGQSRSLDDLKETYILVEIDPTGAVKVDNEPIAAEVSALAGRLRSLRERTHRKAMLLTADFATPHRSAVLAYDAANEIGLGIAIARPKPASAPQGK